MIQSAVNKKDFVMRYITMDETWISHYKSNRLSGKWLKAGSRAHVGMQSSITLRNEKPSKAKYGVIGEFVSPALFSPQRLLISCIKIRAALD